MMFQGVLDLVGSTGNGWLATLIKILVGIATAAVFVVKGLDHVEQGDLALKTRFGRVVKVRFGAKAGKHKEVGPGLRVLVPFVHSLRKTTIRERLGDLTPQVNLGKDGYEEVHTKIRFCVVEIYLAQLVCEDLHGMVIAICEKHLRDLLGEGKSYADIPNLIQGRVRLELAGIGVELNKLMIVKVAATTPTQVFTQFRNLAGPDLMPLLHALLSPNSPNGSRPGDAASAPLVSPNSS